MSVSALLSSSCALYDPIIILVMEPTTSHFPRSKSISHLTLRASPQIRLLSLVQSLCSGLQSDSLVCFRVRTPLLCLSRARPRHRPSPPTPQQRRCPSWITTHRWVMRRQGSLAFYSPHELYIFSASYLCWLHLNIMNFEYLLEKTSTCISYSSLSDISPLMFFFLPLSLL